MDNLPVKIVILVLVSPLFWVNYTQVIPFYFKEAMKENATFLNRYFSALGCLVLTIVPIAITASMLAV
jgi:hypothetical protein